MSVPNPSVGHVEQQKQQRNPHKEIVRQLSHVKGSSTAEVDSGERLESTNDVVGTARMPSRTLKDGEPESGT